LNQTELTQVGRNLPKVDEIRRNLRSVNETDLIQGLKLILITLLLAPSINNQQILGSQVYADLAIAIGGSHGAVKLSHSTKRLAYAVMCQV
jgi:hypothetical protein